MFFLVCLLNSVACEGHLSCVWDYLKVIYAVKDASIYYCSPLPPFIGVFPFISSLRALKPASITTLTLIMALSLTRPTCFKLLSPTVSAFFTGLIHHTSLTVCFCYFFISYYWYVRHRPHSYLALKFVYKLVCTWANESTGVSTQTLWSNLPNQFQRGLGKCCDHIQ